MTASRIDIFKQMLATDPGTVRDFRAFCEATGHELLEHAEQDGEYTFRIRKRR